MKMEYFRINDVSSILEKLYNKGKIKKSLGLVINRLGIAKLAFKNDLRKEGYLWVMSLEIRPLAALYPPPPLYIFFRLIQ